MAFKKGESGNPGGRPKLPEDLKEAASAHTVRAIEVLAGIMNDEKIQPAARVRAAEILLKKTMPDLSSMDMTAELETRSTYFISDQLPTEEEWEARHCRDEH
jgi:hypothetical protein